MTVQPITITIRLTNFYRVVFAVVQSHASDICPAFMERNVQCCHCRLPYIVDGISALQKGHEDN